MKTETLIEEHGPALQRRLSALLGSPEGAEDVAQEALLRLWQRGPGEDAPASERVAWLNRTASNLAVDELRRRRVRNHAELDDAAVAAISGEPDETLAVREALARLSAHQRLLVTLRFQAGMTHREIGELLAIEPEAARKRVAAAKREFGRMLRGLRGSEAPVILLAGRDPAGPYVSWLEAAGAEVRLLRPGSIDGQIAGADGFVLGGGAMDIDPRVYGEEPRHEIVRPDIVGDAKELRVLRAALEAGLPYVGICKGAQLLNVALGGNLFQDLVGDGLTQTTHRHVEHGVETRRGTQARRILGRQATVLSDHHQAVRRLGRGLIPTTVSPDGVAESIELPGGPLAIGLQWHPETTAPEAGGNRVAQALVAAASHRNGARDV